MEHESYYRVQLSPPIVLVMSQMHLLKALRSRLLTIHFNIILPSNPRSIKWSLSFTLSNQSLYALITPMRATCLADGILNYFIT
jgi:hypothetical protein